jgi:predicted CxxxxCH...CXXCH cytochrome family protein
MKSYLRLGFGNYQAVTVVCSTLLMLLGATVAQAAPQYVITCDFCHRMPPLDSPSGTRDDDTGAVKGNHQGHAGGSAASCTKCHGDAALGYTTYHRNKAIEIQGNINNSPASGGYSRAFVNQTSVPPDPLGFCSNVNCHFESATAPWGSPRFAAPADCSSCHQMAPTTGSHPVPGSKHGSYYGTGAGSCLKCHPDHAGAVQPFAHATSVAQRGIALSFTTFPNSGGSYSGDGKNFLPSQHKTGYGTCSNLYCHSNGAGGAPNLVPTWGARLDCTGCHGFPPAYPNGQPKANSHLSHSFSCNVCHAQTTADGTTVSDPSRHVNHAVEVAPGPGVSFSYVSGSPGGFCGNVSCHGGASAAWGSSGGHDAQLGSGDILMFAGVDNTDHRGNFSIGQNCTLCHYASLVAQHGNNCSLCHSGANPAGSLVGTWNKTCQQGACHPTMHAAMTSDHFGMYWGSSRSCDLCHDQVGGFPGSGDNCSRCHSPAFTAAAVGDHQPPVTTSDAQASYLGPAYLHLQATDAGSGVSNTRYSLNGAGWKLGNEIYLSAPLTGTRSYTLQYFSADHAMNQEPVQTVSFTVRSATPDATPPATVSSFNPGAGAVFNANQAVTLSASDAGSGVRATYYRVDAGAFSAGTSFTVSGEGLHSFGYYSVDNAINTETLHTSNSFRIDTIAPTTTCSALTGSSYTGAQSFALTPADPGGSGVASTWYRLDSGAWISGSSAAVAAPAAGNASHTLSWYSRDLAGNQEATHSVSFTLLAPADTTRPVTSSSFNPIAGALFKANQQVTLSALDNSGGSGVKTTYYKVDAGAFSAGTSFTVSGEGLHSFSYYSVDNANNTESAVLSSTFRIDSLAPLTSCSAQSGASYTGSQSFVLGASDSGGSGVAGSWYQLDGGAWSAGSTVAVAAPASGVQSHTISWYSRDLAGNQETTRSVSFTLQAPAAPVSSGTTKISFRTNADLGGWSYVYWEVWDANGNALPDLSFFNDDSAHPGSMIADFDVPSGAAYTLYGEVGWMPDGPIVDSYTRAITAAEAASGATVTQWFH